MKLFRLIINICAHKFISLNEKKKIRIIQKVFHEKKESFEYVDFGA